MRVEAPPGAYLVSTVGGEVRRYPCLDYDHNERWSVLVVTLVLDSCGPTTITETRGSHALRDKTGNLIRNFVLGLGLLLPKQRKELARNG